MLFDLVRVRVLSTGTGPLQIGGADGGGRSFAAAGVTAGKKISYGIADGTARETGTGTFDGTFVSRGFRFIGPRFAFQRLSQRKYKQEALICQR